MQKFIFVLLNILESRFKSFNSLIILGSPLMIEFLIKYSNSPFVTNSKSDGLAM